MFRRKEEGLFDSDTDLEKMESEEMQEEKSLSHSPSASFSSAPSTNSMQSQSPALSSQQTVSQPVQRSNNVPPTASSFRPAPSPSTPAADLSRNRIPESKQPATSVTASFTNPLPTAGDKMKTNVTSNGKRVLTVGNDILLKGEIATCDRLVIEGKVDATLNDVHTVEIAECGSFKGSAQIEDAEISGLFEGDLTVRGRLIIYATGKVRGKISYGEIEIERGGELTGEIKIAGASAVNTRPAVRNNAPKDDRVAA